MELINFSELSNNTQMIEQRGKAKEVLINHILVHVYIMYVAKSGSS